MTSGSGGSACARDRATLPPAWRGEAAGRGLVASPTPSTDLTVGPRPTEGDRASGVLPQGWLLLPRTSDEPSSSPAQRAHRRSSRSSSPQPCVPGGYGPAGRWMIEREGDREGVSLKPAVDSGRETPPQAFWRLRELDQHLRVGASRVVLLAVKARGSRVGETRPQTAGGSGRSRRSTKRSVPRAKRPTGTRIALPGWFGHAACVCERSFVGTARADRLKPGSKSRGLGTRSRKHPCRPSSHVARPTEAAVSTTHAAACSVVPG